MIQPRAFVAFYSHCRFEFIVIGVGGNVTPVFPVVTSGVKIIVQRGRTISEVTMGCRYYGVSQAEAEVFNFDSAIFKIETAPEHSV